MLNYNQFIFNSFLNNNSTNLLESLVTSTKKLLKSIDAEEVDLFDTFDLNKTNFDKNFSLEFLYNNKQFNSFLVKNNLKKSDINSTEDSETFLEKIYNVKFFYIHKLDQSDIEKPQWLILQSKKQEEKNWNPVKCYEVNNDMRYFYDEISSKTIEIEKNGEKYIYRTSNSGTDWVLQNINKKNDTFKEILTNDEIKDILVDKSTNLNVI